MQSCPNLLDLLGYTSNELHERVETNEGLEAETLAM